jgi:hypothetical protein
VNNIEEWVRGHDSQLEDIAAQANLATPLVHLAAMLVLSGLQDEEIYELLSDHIVSMDGQTDPLEGAPRALEEIRSLVAT